MKTLKRDTGQLSIFSYLIPAENRRQNNQAFQTRIQEAGRARLSTSLNTVDGGQFRAYNVYHFHRYIQVLTLIFLP